MIIAHIPFECPQCGRGYHIEIDLLKLSRLNRVAVCGRCRNEFSVQVRFDDTPDGERPMRPRFESQPRMPAAMKSSPPLRSAPPGDSRPPLNSDPPPSSRPRPFPGDHRASDASRRRPSSDPPPSDPLTPSPPPKSYPRWPSSGINARPSPFARSSSPTMPGGGGAPDSSRPSPFKRQIVVDVANVGSEGTARRQRRTFSPENLVTRRGGSAPPAEDEDDR